MRNRVLVAVLLLGGSGRSESPVGDVHAIVGDGAHAFVSNGKGVASVALRCE